ncbi:MAG TPA: hypothetical protein ENH94_03505 [Phycisphaerales bacterium]|nr:hypothetical protein [Phycisphaerales bacterium]
MKNTIKIMVSDRRPTSGILNCVYEILEKDYNVVECADADYFISGSWEPLKNARLIQDRISIYLNTEATAPDFNLFDYAVGFDDLHFGDRYLKYLPAFMGAVGPEYMTVSDPLARRFCNFIYSNPISHPNRELVFHKLSRNYKQVDSLGSILKNVSFDISPRNGDWYPGNVEAKSRYKFSVAFENAYYPGYTSEKILTSYQARSIPIYWGNPDIHKIANPDSFINCHDYDNFDQVVEKVRELDTNDEKYLTMLNADKGAMGTDEFFAENHTRFTSFFRNIFDQPLEKARRRPVGAAVDGHRNTLILINNLGYSDVYENQAKELIKKNKPKEAYDKISKAIELRPGFPDYYFIRANILYSMKDFESSMQSLSVAIQIDPSNTAYTKLMSTLQQQIFSP